MSQHRLSSSGKTEWDNHTLQEQQRKIPFYLSNKNYIIRFSFMILILTYVGKIEEGNNVETCFHFLNKILYTKRYL